MKDLAILALDAASSSGASYADIRIVESRHEEIRIRNERIEAAEAGESTGFGVRVVCDGAWGFAASRDVNRQSVKATALLAVRVAKASASARKKDVILATAPKAMDHYKTPIVRDPFHVPLEEKLNLLFLAAKEARGVKGIKTVACRTEFWRDRKFFASTVGSLIEQDIFHSGGGIFAKAVSPDEVQHRSYPNSFGGDYRAGGYEVIEHFQLPQNARRTAEEAVALLSAAQCPSGTTTVVLDGTQVSLQIHESCGHAVELDRVLGSEVNFAGTSFLTLDKLGRLQYGSPHVNITADATCPGGLGTFGYDDEGIPAFRADLVKEGLLTGYLTSRETAATLGQESNGTMRAEGWQNFPLIRMTNINLLPGKHSFDGLLADVEDGVYMETNRSWSIDDRRVNFQFGTEIGREIKKGKLGRLLKNPTYTGITVEFWNSCDAVGEAALWDIWGTPNCGKGQPMQSMRTAQGAAPARFRNVKVGVGYRT
ncbi:MAG: TldD/PmbA family protein [Armatimonadetes bacterium]|nr:TldD/PmbA family protein [Armatimonadota bacterium]